MTDNDWLGETVNLAHAALIRGDPPFAAILVADGGLLYSAQNTCNSERSVLKHAELNLLSVALLHHDSNSLGMASLFCSAEPCLMCLGAIYWSGIRRVIYRDSQQDIFAIRGFGAFLPTEQYKDILPHLEITQLGTSTSSIPLLQQFYSRSRRPREAADS